MKPTSDECARPFERWLLGLEKPPWSVLYRAVIGFASGLLFFRLFGREGTAGELAWVLLGVLFALRIVPAVLRQLLPFSVEAKALWKEKRQLAKRFDSYQWQKLFWIGLGLEAYLLTSGFARFPHLAMGMACVAAGGLGLLFWRRRFDATPAPKILVDS